MTRSAAVTVENSFIHGLITEATELNFPESACTETYNCIFNEKGSVYRRLGYDYESGFSLIDVGGTLTNFAISGFVWNNVGGDGTLTFVVTQVGSTLTFFRGSESSLSASGVFTVGLNTFKVSGAPGPEEKECFYASGNGALFVVHPYCEPFYVEWDIDTSTHTQTAITIQIRDFAGKDDGLAVDDRPTTLSTNHKYNLYNQGWYASAVSSDDFKASGDGDGVQPVLTYWHTKRSDYPSNADIWWVYKNAADIFNTAAIDRFYRGNTHAPKGHYILTAFRQDRTAISGISGITVDSSGFNRPRGVAFHADRVFYAGVQADNYTNKIYFSQAIEDKTQYGKCYQENDPTSEDISDLLPTDGGVISIIGAGTIIYLTSVQNSLLVFTTNGIWSISGNQGAAFAANDYSVAKISDVATQSGLSFVNVGGFPVFWTNDGIYGATIDQVSASIQIQCITDKTIKTFYDDIPTSSKSYAKGAYNARTKIVQWIYRSTEGVTLQGYNQADRILCFNTLTGAFYPWEIPVVSSTNGPFIVDAFSLAGIGSVREAEDVFDNNGVVVVDNSSAIVTVSSVSLEYLTSTIQYMTLVKSGSTYKLTFSQERNGDYKDFVTATGSGIDYDSFGLVGYKVHGQGTMKFQSNYLSLYMKQETDASLWFQGWWDYANTINSGRVSMPQQVYIDKPEFNVSKRRIKIRGHGIELQYKFYSEAGKPFTIIGWSGFETGNSQP